LPGINADNQLPSIPGNKFPGYYVSSLRDSEINSASSSPNHAHFLPKPNNSTPNPFFAPD